MILIFHVPPLEGRKIQKTVKFFDIFLGYKLSISYSPCPLLETQAARKSDVF